MEEYAVEDFSLGDKVNGDKIIFKSVETMEKAYRDIDVGKDIYILKDGLVTKLLHQMISSKIYDGSIVISARKKGAKIIEDQGGQ